jgi:beta-lactam-binding protein with PASTA domain
VGKSIPKDIVIQMQVSPGNQFVVPDLTKMFWTDAERSCGTWTPTSH